MKIQINGYNGPGIFLCGMLKALRYDPQKKYPRQRVSFSIFMTGVRRMTEWLAYKGHDNSLDNVNSMLHTLTNDKGFRLDPNTRIVEYKSGSMIGALPISSNNKEFVETVAFRFSYLRGGKYEFEVDLNSNDKVRYQALIMMQWMLLDHEVSEYLIEIDQHKIKMGLMLAAKLYELHGDIAGKMATIDEAYDGH